MGEGRLPGSGWQDLARGPRPVTVQGEERGDYGSA